MCMKTSWSCFMCTRERDNIWWITAFIRSAQGDIVVCNAGVLHGEEPSLVRQIHSYSIAVTGAQFEGLPPNCLTDRYTNPVVSCGQLAVHVGQLMQLLYLLSADTAHLGNVCGSLAYSMLLLTQALLNSRARNEAIDEMEQPSVLAHRVRQYLDEHHSEGLHCAQYPSSSHQRILSGACIQAGIRDSAHAVCDEAPHR